MLVGMTGLEPATSRTPCVRSKPSELHPGVFVMLAKPNLLTQLLLRKKL